MHLAHHTRAHAPKSSIITDFDLVYGLHPCSPTLPSIKSNKKYHPAPQVSCVLIPSIFYGGFILTEPCFFQIGSHIKSIIELDYLTFYIFLHFFTFF